MLDFEDDYMETIRKEIHGAANRFREEERPRYRLMLRLAPQLTH